MHSCCLPVELQLEVDTIPLIGDSEWTSSEDFQDAYEIVFLSLNYCATANYATHIELRIHLDNICKFSSLKAAHSWIAQDLGALS